MSPPKPIDLNAHVDAEHLAVLNAIPVGTMSLHDIPAARLALDALLASLPKPPPPAGVTIEDIEGPGVNGGPAVRVRVYRPANQSGSIPALFWIHGGGMVLGSVERDDPRCASIASSLGIVVVSVDYRLAPEHPYPAPMDDCYAGLTWLAKSAAELSVDPERIAIGGASAGAGLAAGLALLARDRGGPAICFQQLVYPMIDDRNSTASSFAIADTRVWNRESNLIGWSSYLGELTEPPIYAAPARAVDLAGLPPAYISVGSLDMFLDEDVDYARRLLAAGVAAELHVYPGAFHGSNGIVPNSALSRRWIADERDALRRALFDEAVGAVTV